MKRESGLGIVGVIILIFFIIATIVTVYYFVQKNQKETEKSDIYSNMLLIQGVCKVLKETSTANKEKDALVGTKLSEFENEEENNESTNNKEENKTDENKNETEKNENKNEDIIVSEFKQLEIISKEEYEKYYVLKNDDLEKLKIDVKNEKDSYYLINYENNEVIITKGYQGKYKLSEFE